MEKQSLHARSKILVLIRDRKRIKLDNEILYYFSRQPFKSFVYEDFNEEIVEFTNDLSPGIPTHQLKQSQLSELFKMGRLEIL